MKHYSTIKWTYLSTILVGGLYTFLKIIKEPDAGERSLGIVISALFFISIALFIESLLIIILLRKNFPKVLPTIFSILIVSSIFPTYIIYNNIRMHNESLPINIPPPGKVPVLNNQFQNDTTLILSDCRNKLAKTNNINFYQDTILDLQLDTIIYSKNIMQFFSTIILTVKSGNISQYNIDYRVGEKSGNHWILKIPIGNIYMMKFNTKQELKSYTRQYFYKMFSINGSSNKPEIWNDEYIFVKQDEPSK